MYRRKQWLLLLLIVLSIVLSGCSQGIQDIISRSPFGEKLDNPAITECISKADGLEIRWDPVQDADRYQVYRKQKEDDWSLISETDTQLYLDTDVNNEQSYSYFISSFSDHIRTANADMDEDCHTVTFYEMPQDLIVSNGVQAVHLEWKSMNSIDRYKILKKEIENAPSTAENNWKELSLVDGNSFEDESVINGNTYSYTVCCVDKDGEQISAYDDIGQSITYIDTPIAPDLKNTLNGVDIAWNPVEGVEKYRIYRQILSESDYPDSDLQTTWEPFAIVDSTIFTDTKVDNNVRYSYTVCCLDKEGKTEISSYDPSGSSITFFHAPEDMKIANTFGGVKLIWTPVNGVNKYEIYRHSDEETFRAFSVSDTASYIDKDVVSGQKYTYSVACLGDDESTEISAYDDKGVGIRYISSPANIKTQNTKEGVSVSWDKSEGAGNYRVYKKNKEGKWTKVKDTKENKITDTKVKSGTEYVYTVKCINKEGTEGISGLDPNGKNQLYLAPVLGKKVNLKNTNDGISITWPKIAGADSYVVYRGSADKKMARIDVVNGGDKTEYLDAGRKNGKLYTYAIRARSAKNGEVLGYYSKKNIVCIKQSVINTLKAKVESFTVNWKGNDKASNYEIQYSTDKNFKKNKKTVTVSAETKSKTLENLDSGKKYYVRVRSCIKENNKKYYSAWAKTQSVKPKKKPAPVQTRSSSGSSGTMVWIPRTGKKYHSYSGCSNMKNPSQVTKSEAESMGYDRCSKCW